MSSKSAAKPAKARSPMSDDLLLRYSRQIMLPEFDIEGQERLRNSSALVVGLGGLGCPAALYLASAGIGELILADSDQVDLTNLQRQIAHSQAMIGENKAASVAQSIRAINNDVALRVHRQDLAGADLPALVGEADVVLDCTDSYLSRSAINRACACAKVALVSGAAIRWEGQLSVFDFRLVETPCYYCLYGDISQDQLSCSQTGVMSPVVGVIGSMQALEAIKLVTQTGKAATGRVLLFDGMVSAWREFQLSRDPQCVVCGSVKPV